jgi:hypothetical protein
MPKVTQRWALGDAIGRRIDPLGASCPPVASSPAAVARAPLTADFVVALDRDAAGERGEREDVLILITSGLTLAPLSWALAVVTPLTRIAITANTVRSCGSMTWHFWNIGAVKSSEKAAVRRFVDAPSARGALDLCRSERRHYIMASAARLRPGRVISSII